MRLDRAFFRQIHRTMSVIMFLPILLTLITGVIYQIGDLSEQPNEWMLDLHKGNFGIINLEKIYPFLNATGLLFLAITGLSLWLRTKSKARV
jgi:hypothetical protein